MPWYDVELVKGISAPYFIFNVATLILFVIRAAGLYDIKQIVLHAKRYIVFYIVLPIVLV